MFITPVYAQNGNGMNPVPRQTLIHGLCNEMGAEYIGTTNTGTNEKLRMLDRTGRLSGRVLLRPGGEPYHVPRCSLVTSWHLEAICLPSAGSCRMFHVGTLLRIICEGAEAAH